MKFLYCANEQTLAIRSAQVTTCESDAAILTTLGNALTPYIHERSVSCLYTPYIPMEEGYQFSQSPRCVYFSTKEQNTHEMMVINIATRDSLTPGARRITIEDLLTLLNTAVAQTENTQLEETGPDAFNFYCFDKDRFLKVHPEQQNRFCPFNDEPVPTDEIHEFLQARNPISPTVLHQYPSELAKVVRLKPETTCVTSGPGFSIKPTPAAGG